MKNFVWKNDFSKFLVIFLQGLGLDPDELLEEAYSPSDSRSFTPPPQLGPILNNVSDIKIPANLQEILASVKRQEFSTKVDPYLPSKPGASFLTTSSYVAPPPMARTTSSDSAKESSKSSLSSMSDLDLIKKAEEELATLSAMDGGSGSYSTEPKPPGLEDEEYVPFPASLPPPPELSSPARVKRKMSDEDSPSPSKRTKSRWGQPPTE